MFAVIEDDPAIRLYWVVDEKPKRSRRLARLGNIEHNPAVELVVDGYDEDWDRLWWVRASGNGRVVGSQAERDAALTALRAKYPQYATIVPSGPVIAIDVETITGWEAERSD